jgi:hypothetical protein
VGQNSFTPQKWSPQYVQSMGHAAAPSDGAQNPSPQRVPQSLHVIGDSLAPQTPSPQMPQSYGHDAVDSPNSQREFPQTPLPQSTEQMKGDSFCAQMKSPQ